jgi:hypothetical protein
LCAKGGRGRQPCRICGGQVHNQADDGLLDMVAAADAESANLDQPGESRGRADQQLSGDCGEMDTVIADQDGWRHLARSSAQDEIESEARFPGA